jgi:hypothetical protein
MAIGRKGLQAFQQHSQRPQCSPDEPRSRPSEAEYPGKGQKACNVVKSPTQSLPPGMNMLFASV